MRLLSTIHSLVTLCVCFDRCLADVARYSPYYLPNKGISSFPIYTEADAARCYKASITLPPHNLERYPVPGTNVTLEFFAFGPIVPAEEPLEELTSAMEAVTRKVRQGKQNERIPEGLFIYIVRFPRGQRMITTICDFHQRGRPLDWGTLGHVLRGVGSWIDVVWQISQQMSFNVVVDGLGMVAFGYTRWDEPAPSSSLVKRGVAAAPTGLAKREVRVLDATQVTRRDRDDVLTRCRKSEPGQGANVVPYHNPRFRTSLELFNFGDEVPRPEMFGSFVSAINLVIKKGEQGQLNSNLPGVLYIHSVVFDNGDNITTSMRDFDFDGRPMTWKDAGEVLRGLVHYMRYISEVFQEVNFNVIGPHGELLGVGSTAWERKEIVNPLATE